jgi:rod shape-determining protein MreB
VGILDFFRCDIAVDLGTANTVIIQNGKIILDEPSIIAIEKSTNKVLAVGSQAMNMHEKTHENIKTIKPLKDGVIADFNASEIMMTGMLRMVHEKNNRKFFNPFVRRIVVCIPSGITEVEKRAVRDSAEKTGAKEIYMITEPIAAAIGIGVDIKAPIGNMIVDIGGGTTEIALIALSGIVCDKSIKIAGDVFNFDILDFIKKNYNLLIGERTAEKIKITIGSACQNFDKQETMNVPGRDLSTGKPRIISISSNEIAISLDSSLSKIETSIMKALELSPPELSADIYENGIFLTGGGALLKGFADRISKKTELQVHVTEDPLYAVVRGTGIVLNDIKNYSAVIMS